MKTNPLFTVIILSSMSLLPSSFCNATTLNSPVVNDNADSKFMFTVKGDTLVYDMNGITFNEKSSVGSVLSKFPAVEGASYVNGKRISAVLIDGKEFIGEIDNSALLGKIPAYMVKTIQVYEREPENVRGRSSAKATIKEQVINLQLADGYRDRFKGELEGGAGMPFYVGDYNDKKTLFAGNAFGMKSTEKSRIMASVSGDNIDGSSSPFSGSTANSKIGGCTVNVNGLYQINKESRYQGKLEVEYDENEALSTSVSLDYQSSIPKTKIANSSANTYNKSLTTTHEFKYRSYNDVLGMFQNPDVYLRANASFNKKDQNSYSSQNTYLNDIVSNPDIYALKHQDQVCTRRKYNSVNLYGHAIASPINNDKIDLRLSFSLAHQDTKETENRMYGSYGHSDYNVFRFHPYNTNYDYFNVGMDMSIALDNNEKHHLNFADTYRIHSYDSHGETYTWDEYNMYSVLTEPILDDAVINMKSLSKVSENTNTFDLFYTFSSKDRFSNKEHLLKVGADMPLIHEKTDYMYAYNGNYSSVDDVTPTHYEHNNFFVNPYVTYQFKNVPKGLEVCVNGNVTNHSYSFSDDASYKRYMLNAFAKFRIGRSMINSSLEYRKYSKEYTSMDWYTALSIKMDIPLSSDDKWRIKDRFVAYHNEYSSDRNSFISYEYFDLVFRPSKKVELSAISYINNNKQENNINGNNTSTSTYDFYYGLSTVLELPFDFQLTANGLNYCRRKYEKESDNTSTFVVNAGLTKRFMNGKLLISFDGHDLLGRMKPSHKTVTATTVMTQDKNSFPSYGMMRATYRF